MGRKRTATTPHSGREEAIRRYPAPLGPCERCLAVPATDRHHIDANPLHNERSNLAFLCTRCHMAIDGRLEALRAAASARQPAMLRARWDKPRVRPTACVHGHSYTPENTHIDRKGGYRCRECARAADRLRAGRRVR